MSLVLCFINRPTLLVLILGLLSVLPAAAQDQKIEGGCGANAANISNSTVTVNVDCGIKGPPMTIYYSRLFGAFEVPLLMDILSAQSFRPAYQGGGYFVYDRVAPNPEPMDWITPKIIQFRDRYPYKGAMPILTTFWKDISGSQNAAATLGLKATAGSRRERRCFFLEPFIEGGSLYEYETNRRFWGRDTPESCAPVYRKADMRVGFTFLVVENTSPQSVTDIQIYYRQNYSDRAFKVEHDVQASDVKIAPLVKAVPIKGGALSNLIKISGKARDVEDAVADRPLDFFFVAKLDPGQKLIALMNIYIAGDKLLPASYLYGIYKFEEMSYALNGMAGRMEIRRPSGEKAARVEVPFGWFLQ